MNNYNTRMVRLLPLLLVVFLMFGSLQTVQAQAQTITVTNQLPQASTQLAYYYGGHWYRHPGHYWGPGHVYYGPRYYHYYYAPHVYRSIWSGWRPYGYRCQRTCLVNQWSGVVVRCVRRCY